MQVANSSDPIVQDVTDVEHPVAVPTVRIPSFDSIGFAGRSAISAAFGPNYGGITRVPIGGGTALNVANPCDGGTVATFAWNRDGTMLAYMWERALPRNTGFDSVIDLHLAGRGSDRVIATVSASCQCGGAWADNFSDIYLAFSPDGRYLAWVANIGIAADFQVRRLDGSLVGRELRTTDPQAVGRYPTFAVWAGPVLYFRDPGGLEAWRDGVVTPAIPGLRWVRPSVAGSFIVYLLVDANGFHRAWILDLSSGSSRLTSPDPRNGASFIANGYVWYVLDRKCYCAPGPAYLYDVPAGTESPSQVDYVFDTWPGNR